MSYYQIATRGLTFPYQCKSPTLHKKITYDENELWNEIDRILKESENSKFTIGTNLYHNLLLCADSSYFTDSETYILIEEFMAMKRFNIPLASNIDEADYERVVIHSAIDDEYQAILRKEQDGKK